MERIFHTTDSLTSKVIRIIVYIGWGGFQKQRLSKLNITHFLVHVNTVHKNQKNFSCTVCKTKFGSEGEVTRHMEDVHGNKIWKCDRCHDIFPREYLLKKHMEEKHFEMKRSKYPSKQFVKE